MNEGLAHSRVLIVDDDPSNRALLETILARNGFTNVASADSAASALESLLQDEPDLIMLDLHMSGVDGFEFLVLLSEKMPQDHYLPVLIITGDATPETRNKALASGAHDFLTKPYEMAEVVLRASNLLETRRLHRQLETRLEAEEQLSKAQQILATVADRERIANELYERVIHRIFACAMSLQSIHQVIEGPEAAAAVRKVVSELDQTVIELRNAIFGLEKGFGPGAGPS
jgi:PleD family two-component response regulator